jgi:hypothetical protein
VSTLDILPTISAAANVALPVTKQVDGVNLLPYLDRPAKGAPHDVLYWKLDDSAAVRRGQWKLYIDTAEGIATLHDHSDLHSSLPAKVRTPFPEPAGTPLVAAAELEAQGLAPLAPTGQSATGGQPVGRISGGRAHETDVAKHGRASSGKQRPNAANASSRASEWPGTR